MDSEKSRGNSESPLQSALDFLRESIGTVPPGGRSRRWSFQREVALVAEWATRFGYCLSEDFLQQFKPVSSGAEHEVFFDQFSQCAIKVTRDGRFGHSLIGEGQSALPSEYLQRLIHHNQIFGDNILLQGILATEGNVRIVTSQPWIAENGALADITEADVVEYFESLGFQKSSVADVAAFYNKELDLMVLDANLKNILRDFTGKLFPIDVVVGKPGSEIFERFGF